MTASISRTLFNALVKRGGGVDAAAAVLSAVEGHEVNKSTISRMCSGQINITPEALTALEDHCGFFPFSEYIAGRLSKQQSEGVGQMQQRLESVLKECGEAGVAGLNALGGGDRAATVTECHEAISALQSFIAALEARE